MALQKTITNPITGAEPSYWRLLKIEIDIDNHSGLLILGGYRSQQWRDAGGPGRYVDSRRIAIDSAEYAALLAAASAPTLGQTVGGAAYNIIKTKPRMVLGAVLNNDGSLDFAGAHYNAEDVVVSGGVVTIPSEFADAVDV